MRTVYAQYERLYRLCFNTGWVVVFCCLRDRLSLGLVRVFFVTYKCQCSTVFMTLASLPSRAWVFVEGFFLNNKIERLPNLLFYSIVVYGYPFCSLTGVWYKVVICFVRLSLSTLFIVKIILVSIGQAMNKDQLVCGLWIFSCVDGSFLAFFCSGLKK
jgi:hypothetical protein